MYAYLQEWKHVLEWVWGIQNQIKGYESGLRNDYEETKEKFCSTLRAACRCLRWNWQQSPLWMSHSLLIMQSSPIQTTSYFRKQTNNRNPQFIFTFRRLQQSCTEKISTSFFESGRLTYHLKRELFARKLHNSKDYITMIIGKHYLRHKKGAYFGLLVWHLKEWILIAILFPPVQSQPFSKKMAGLFPFTLLCLS